MALTESAKGKLLMCFEAAVDRMSNGNPDQRSAALATANLDHMVEITESVMQVSPEPDAKNVLENMDEVRQLYAGLLGMY